MSENLKRSNPDFSKYDSMSIGELEEILRADAMGPERDDSDVDEILYVMEVLAKKRRQNGIAGKTALEAYQEFQQHYLPVDKEEPKRKSNVIPFRRIAAVAASIVLVFSLTTTANAFSFRDVWDAVVTWAQETFSFSMGIEVSEPLPSDTCEYASLEEALLRAKHNVSIPTAFPSGYEFVDVIVDQNPMQDVFIGIYSNGNQQLKISVRSHLLDQSEWVEQSAGLLEIYHAFGIDFYIFSNHEQIQAAWTTSTYECYISGELSIEEMKMIIDSIGKG